MAVWVLFVFFYFDGGQQQQQQQIDNNTSEKWDKQQRSSFLILDRWARPYLFMFFFFSAVASSSDERRIWNASRKCRPSTTPTGQRGFIIYTTLRWYEGYHRSGGIVTSFSSADNIRNGLNRRVWWNEATGRLRPFWKWETKRNQKQSPIIIYQ